MNEKEMEQIKKDKKIREIVQKIHEEKKQDEIYYTENYPSGIYYGVKFEKRANLSQ